MRKRLVIGAIAVVVIGVGVYVVSQPRKGTVEYHKREYLAASRGSKLGQLIGNMGQLPCERRFIAGKLSG